MSAEPAPNTCLPIVLKRISKQPPVTMSRRSGRFREPNSASVSLLPITRALMSVSCVRSATLSQVQVQMAVACHLFMSDVDALACAESVR